MLKTNKIIKK